MAFEVSELPQTFSSHQKLKFMLRLKLADVPFSCCDSNVRFHVLTLSTTMATPIASGQQSIILTTLQDFKTQHTQDSEDRVQELDCLLQKLNSMTVNMDSLRKLQLTAASKKDVEECFHQLLQVANKARELKARLKILNSLCFKSMMVRHSKIAEAHKGTFDWIFNSSELPSTDPRSNVKFINWLRRGEGTYWISGKPGSGKSTLMKYLYDHKETRELLHQRALPDTLVTGSYFSWSAGTDMQKSQEGLLQSLLLQILEQCPDLIPNVCVERWSFVDDHVSKDWTLSELLCTFSRLLSQTYMSTRFCFFVDGLDEYDGDHFNIIEALELLIASQKVKLCLSSRP